MNIPIEKKCFNCINLKQENEFPFEHYSCAKEHLGTPKTATNCDHWGFCCKKKEQQ